MLGFEDIRSFNFEIYQITDIDFKPQSSLVNISIVSTIGGSSAFIEFDDVRLFSFSNDYFDEFDYEDIYKFKIQEIESISALPEPLMKYTHKERFIGSRFVTIESTFHLSIVSRFVRMYN